MNRDDFLFLDRSGCKIIKWCQCAQTVETIVLERKYRCVCFDYKENCYWVIHECTPSLIYRLDAFFCEVGHIPIGDTQQHITSLCCDDSGNGIWVCFPYQLAFVEKCSGKVTWHKNEDNRKTNVGVLMQCECRVNCYNEGGRQIIEVISPRCHESIELCVPNGQKVEGMASCFCEHNNNCHFYVLLSNIHTHEFVLTEYCVDLSQKSMKTCCSCQPPPEPCPPKSPFCGSYEIMHSIALEEAGISHILNAEGEKIQKAVAISNNIEQLLDVNDSVKRTLTQVTLLEGMLYSKLEALVSCDECRERHEYLYESMPPKIEKNS